MALAYSFVKRPEEIAASKMICSFVMAGSSFTYAKIAIVSASDSTSSP